MSDTTAVTALAWIPRGKALAKPRKHVATRDELTGVINDLQGGIGELEAADPRALAVDSSEEEIDADVDDEFDMANYDNEPGIESNMFSVLEHDLPLLQQPDPYADPAAVDDSDEEEYITINPTDLLLIATNCEEDMCSLEVYLFEHESASMYVHHDIMLSGYPLCVDWVPTAPRAQQGNFAAVGLYNNNIEIWDLDTLDVLAPAATLPGKAGVKPNKSKKRGHVGPVLAVHCCPAKPSVLASGSADNTVRLWDLNDGSLAETYDTIHTSKVQCVKWHPTEVAVLLTAAFDQTACIADARTPGRVAKFVLPADAEFASWSMARPWEALVSSEDGVVTAFDVRKIAAGEPDKAQAWQLKAHDKAVTCFCELPAQPGCFITGSLDKTVKVWDTRYGAAKHIHTKDMQVGALFSCSPCSDEGTVVTFGGQQVAVWDVGDDDLVGVHFGLREP